MINKESMQELLDDSNALDWRLSTWEVRAQGPEWNRLVVVPCALILETDVFIIPHVGIAERKSVLDLIDDLSKRRKMMVHPLLNKNE
jgi:hypothetical protein